MSPSLPDDILGRVFAFCDVDTRIQFGDIRRLNKKDARYMMLRQCFVAQASFTFSQLATYLRTKMNEIEQMDDKEARCIVIATIFSRIVTSMSTAILGTEIRGIEHVRDVCEHRLYANAQSMPKWFDVLTEQWGCMRAAWKKGVAL
jgi:hypothetical protein